MTDSDAQRIRDAFNQDLTGYRLPSNLAERARAGGLRRARRQRTYRVACTAAVACAAAATVVAVAPWTGTGADNGQAVPQLSPGSRTGPGPAASGQSPSAASGGGFPRGSDGLPSAAAVGTAMLASFDAARDDIVYDEQTGFAKNVAVDEERIWFWPVQPATGQLVREREIGAARTSRSGATLPAIEDYGEVYIAPASPNAKTSISVTMVCYPSAADTGGACGDAQGNTAPGTWSRVTAWYEPETSIVGPGGMLNPGVLAQAIKQGQWRVLGRTQIDGQQVIELGETSSGFMRPMPVLLWVNAQTYLPLKMTTAVSVDDFAYLPPTQGNLKLLQVPVPRDYQRSSR